MHGDELIKNIWILRHITYLKFQRRRLSVRGDEKAEITNRRKTFWKSQEICPSGDCGARGL